MAAFTSCTSSFEALKLKYDSSRVEFFQTQFTDNEGFMTDNSIKCVRAKGKHKGFTCTKPGQRELYLPHSSRNCTPYCRGGTLVTEEDPL